MQWVDEVLKQALKRQRPHYMVTDWKTPSGKVHVGALRGVVIHDAVYKALKQRKATTFQYGFDDYDPMDSIPVYLDAKIYRPHFGKPLSEIPSPEPGFSSFAEYYAQDFLQAIAAVGAKPKITWSSKLYKAGKFNQAIKTVLGHASKVNELWSKISKSRRDRLPVQVICEKCGSIFHTKATSWNGKAVSYVCTNCHNKGSRSPFNGGAKLPWRVEWAAKWLLFKSDVEGAGKDHNTKGGAHDVAAAIAEQIFKIEVPINIVYEFFLVGGKKMSTSKGVGESAREIVELVPPELVRFLMEATRPGRAINFDPAQDTIPRLFDQYDKIQKNYQLRFSKVAFLSQITHIDILNEARKDKSKALTAVEKNQLKKRIEYAKKWLVTYAPQEYRFVVQQELPKISLSSQQKKFLAEVQKNLSKEKRWQGNLLHSAIHDVKNHLGIKPTDAFQAIYKIFLNKDHGPQAGWFLAALDRKFVIERLKQAAR